MSSGVSKSGISSSITVIITIILALVVLGVGLGMVSKAKPVHSVDDLIKQTWNLFNESEENGNVDIDTLCSSGEHSDKMTFVVRKYGLISSDYINTPVDISTKWRCDVPGGEGSCIIKNLNAYGYVSGGTLERSTHAKMEAKIYKGFNSNSPDINKNGGGDDDQNCECLGTWNCYYDISLNGDVSYSNSENILFNYIISTKEGNLVAGWTHTNFTYYYCCPKYFKWNDTLNACCPTDEDDCTPYAEINNFTEYCANSEKISGKSLIEKEYCGVSSSNCQKDKISDGISSDCNSLMIFDNLYKDPYDNQNNDITICLDQSGDCKRSGVQTGQCLRLNFKNYYGNSVYVKDLWFRSGSDGGHNDLYVFGCYDGNCDNNGNGWHIIAENVDGNNVLNHAFVDKKVDMIDICPQKASRDHKIAWVKFTTNESLEAEETYCCYDNTGTFCISKAECDDKGGEIGDSCTSSLDCGGTTTTTTSTSSTTTTNPITPYDLVTFYENDNYDREKETFSTNEPNLCDIDGPGEKCNDYDINIQTWNNVVSSLKIKTDYKVTLYENTGYEGDHITFYSSEGNVPKLGDHERAGRHWCGLSRCQNNWNDAVSSLKIFPENIPILRLYRAKNYKGSNREYDTTCTCIDLTDDDFNDVLTSLKIKDGYEVTLYENDKCNNDDSGWSETINQDTDIVAHNDGASSLFLRSIGDACSP